MEHGKKLLAVRRWSRLWEASAAETSCVSRSFDFCAMTKRNLFRDCTPFTITTIATGEAHFCAPAFSYVLRTKTGTFFVTLFSPISIALRPSRPASRPASKLAPKCFVLIPMVSRRWSSRLALRPASNYTSSSKLFVWLQFPYP